MNAKIARERTLKARIPTDDINKILNKISKVSSEGDFYFVEVGLNKLQINALKTKGFTVSEVWKNEFQISWKTKED